MAIDRQPQDLHHLARTGDCGRRVRLPDNGYAVSGFGFDGLSSQRNDAICTPFPEEIPLIGLCEAPLKLRRRDGSRLSRLPGELERLPRSHCR